LPFYCTKETKLQAFQFKLLHRRIATNDYLYKIGISLTDICTFCEQKKESLIHLFWDCEFVQTFWKKHPTLVDTASDKATELLFDPNNLPGTS